MAPFSSEDDEELIKNVSRNPPIYDRTLSAYRDNVIRDIIWKGIAAQMNKTVGDCKKRWRNIRDGYFRYKRKNKIQPGSSAKRKKIKWVLFHRLSFLEEVPTEKPITCNIEDVKAEINDELEERADGTSNENTCCQLEAENIESPLETVAPAPSTTSKVKKRKSQSTHDEFLELLKEGKKRKQEKINRLLQQGKESDNGPINSFCGHIKSVLQTLPPPLLVQAKKDIYDIITKYELEAFQSNVHYNYNYSESSTNSSSSSSSSLSD